ncbi:MAG: RNA 3'-terminal phosphate cyclase [Candidatus Caldarchaeum sp.]|nr:RNA 3'-terminal phosphate cyclase [Candidatus Caldarchaeum sp.]
MEQFFRLDGSVGEGGGQVLRVAVVLSAILGRPLHIYNIRKKRQNPGLRHQHLTAVNAVRQSCSAVVEGAEVGSAELRFTPRKINASSLNLDTGTAGSTTLVLQSLLPVLCFGVRNCRFTVKGGTNNPNAPTYEYFEKVFIPSASLTGASMGVRLLRRGFYPRGGGVVEGFCNPVKKLKPINLTGRPRVFEIAGLAYTSRLPSHVAERMARACEKVLVGRGFLRVEIRRESLNEGDERCAADPGAGLFLAALCEDGVVLGVDKLGEKGVPAEKVGEAAAADLLEELDSGAPVDRHLGDMLVIYSALADGRSVYEVSRLTSHTITSIKVCELITGCKTSVQGGMNEKAVITVEGIAHVNNNI